MAQMCHTHTPFPGSGGGYDRCTHTYTLLWKGVCSVQLPTTYTPTPVQKGCMYVCIFLPIMHLHTHL